MICGIHGSSGVNNGLLCGVKVLYNKGVLSMVGAKSIILKICDNSKGHFDINTCSFLKLRRLQRYSNESE